MSSAPTGSEAPLPPDGSAVVVPEPSPPPPPPAALPPWYVRLRAALARGLWARGFGSVGLAGFALAPAAIGALALALDHPGAGALLGALAVLLVWLGTTPDDRGAVPAFAGLVAHAIVPLWLGGVVVEAAAAGSSARAALAAWTSFVLLLLPLARAQVSDGRRLAARALLWSWGERATALLVGVFLGRAGLAMFVVASLATADLVLRLVVMHPRADGASRLPPALGRLYAPDGAPQAGVRLALALALALFAVLLVALGAADGWRF